MERRDEIWKKESTAKAFLKGIRGGIPFAKEQFDIMLRLIEARGEPVRSFLDVGCGNGALAGAILSKYPKAAGVLTDFSEPMLREARAHLGRRYAGLSFVLSDFGEKGWTGSFGAHAPFDLAVSGYAIHHQPDKRKREVYGEVCGALKPGGLFLNIEHVSSPTDWVRRVSEDLFVDSIHSFSLESGAAKTRSQIEDEFLNRPEKESNILAPVERQCEWLRKCGFQDVDCYFKVFEFAVFGGRRPK